MGLSKPIDIQSEPLVAFEGHFDAGYFDPPHTHDHAQLSIALTGVVRITVEDVNYVLAPHRAIWIPAHHRHQSIHKHDATFQFVLVDPRFAPNRQKCQVFETTPLIRALIDEMTSFDADSAGDGEREATITRLLLAEIERMPDIPISVALPNDKRLRRVCETIIANPADNRDLDGWAREAGMSRRAFTRLFGAELGMGLTAWRRQARVVEAVSRIVAGESIGNVAFEVGFENPSTFSSVFRQTFGESASSYCRK